MAKKLNVLNLCQKHSIPGRSTRSLLNSIHPDLKRIFEYQWLRLQNIEDEDCFKYIRILLCDWEEISRVKNGLWRKCKLYKTNS
jgi:hypothetical protein